jgi:hypothetical protein
LCVAPTIFYLLRTVYEPPQAAARVHPGPCSGRSNVFELRRIRAFMDDTVEGFVAMLLVGVLIVLVHVFRMYFVFA